MPRDVYKEVSIREFIKRYVERESVVEPENQITGDRYAGRGGVKRDLLVTTKNIQNSRCDSTRRADLSTRYLKVIYDSKEGERFMSITTFRGDERFSEEGKFFNLRTFYTLEELNEFNPD